MIQIRRQDLLELGIDLNGSELEALLTHANEELSLRVGNEILLSLSDEQVQEYKSLVDGGKTEQVSAWLEVNVPEIEDMVYDELAILLGDIAEDSHKLEAVIA
jgi:hypothetical protein